jgi:hypothetical protein
MPNWCDNKLTIKGPRNRVLDFIIQARGELQRCPTDVAKPKIADFSFHQLCPIPDEIMALPYDPHGYEAEHAQWGIKWGAGDSILVSYKKLPGVDLAIASYVYRTPWAPGDIFLGKMAANWKDLSFALSYREEYPTRGRRLFNGGVLVESIDDGPPEKFSMSWKNLYYRAHNKWTKEVL